MSSPEPQKYSDGTLIVCGLVIIGIIAAVVLAKMEDDRIYGPVREARANVERAEREYVEAQRSVALDTLERRARDNLARTKGERPSSTVHRGPEGIRVVESMRECVAFIAGVSDATALRPRWVIDQADRRVAEFVMSDGTIRISCADEERIVTHTPRSG